MIQKIKLAGTSVKVTPRNLFLSTYFNQMYINQVSVPVQITNSRFLLEFRTSLSQIIEEANQMSDSMLKNLLATLAASYNRLDVDKTVDTLLEMNMRVSPSIIDDDDDPTGRTILTKFVQATQERIARLSIESGLSNLLIQDVLTTRGDSLNLRALDAVSLASVADMVDWAQTFYGLFVRQERGDALTQALTSKSGSQPLLLGARALYTLFRTGSGAYVQARENYVMDELFKDITGNKLVTTQEILVSKAYRVTGCNVPDLTFSDSVAGFVWSLNTLMGISSRISDEETVSVSSLVDQIITGIGEKLPFIPSEAGHVSEDRLNAHYKVVYLIHLIRRFMNDDPGDFGNRVTNAIQGNRFFKAEGMEKMFNEELYVLSACFEAFRDTAFYFRDLYRNENLLFHDWQSLHPKKRRQITAFMEEFIISAGTFTYGVDHPAFYKQSGHLTMHTASSMASSPLGIEPYIPESSWTSAMHFVLGDAGDTFLRIGTAGLITGVWYDVEDSELPRNRRILDRATPIRPLFTFKLTLPDTLLTSQLVKMMFSVYPLSKLDELYETDRELYQMIIKMGQLRRFDRVTDLSMAMHLPLEIAEAIWDSSPGVDKRFVDLSEVQGITFVFDPELSPYYEVKELSSERYVTPLVGKFPLLVEEIDSAYMIESLPPLTGIGDDSIVKIRLAQRNMRGGEPKSPQTDGTRNGNIPPDPMVSEPTPPASE